ncbi:MAG: AAA family ATPase [Bacteroidota bacterium]
MSTIYPRQILEHIHAYTAAQGFFFTKQNIANLYLCLKSKPFVILAGISGTGKTQLVRQFARAMGHGDRCFLIPVRPDWTDHTDLLGYVDMQGNFRKQPFLEVLLQAQANPQHPYFVILDEMNLARVEHYFSDVLSIMETREKKEDQIVSEPLMPYGVGRNEKENASIQDLTFPGNLYLIGTINVDESTYPFSRKVLDRANVIEMNEVFLDWPLIEEAVPPLDPVPHAFLLNPYVRLIDVPQSERPGMQPVIRLLTEINEILSLADMPFGYRIRDEILFYLINRHDIRELISHQEAIDLQIVQKILPRITGATASIQQVILGLINLFRPEKVDVFSEGSTYVQIHQSLGDPRKKGYAYARSLQKLLKMYRRYEEEGFTSYWG